MKEVVIARLTSRHDGVYEVKDRDGNLVSSTFLQVIGKCCEIVWSDYLYKSMKILLKKYFWRYLMEKNSIVLL